MAEIAVSLTIQLDGNTRQLTCRYVPPVETPAEEGAEAEEAPARATPPDRQAILNLLQAQGQAECALDEAAIRAFVEKARAATDPLEAVIGTQQDGSYEINVSPTRLCAWLNLIAPRGGKAVTPEQIKSAIAARNISHGLKEAELATALAAGHCKEMLLAEGVEPEAGQPARFEGLLEALRTQRHESDDGDIVDYRDLGALVLVDPGTPLMRRTPAVQGKDGTDIFGRPVAAKLLPDPPFSNSLAGSTPDENDPDLLVATISGAPTLTANGVSVNPLVDVQDVDLSTGNITFDGTLQVKGDIRAGMSVRVAGDVVVGGTIEAAEVVAGGNVVVKGGIIGKSENAPGAREGEQETARISCSGTVQAKFIEHAVIEAGKAIQAEGGVRQSELTAGETVVVGKPGGNTGSLIGGHTRARLLVRAPVLGSPSGVPTLVQVGFNPYLNAERTSTEQQRKRRVEELTKLRQLISFFDQNPAKAVGSMREKAENTRDLYEAEVKALDVKLSELAEQMEFAEGATVEAPKCIHGGVNLQIGPKLLQVIDDKPGGKVHLVDDQVVLS
ncbi:DUF342 domain-containing protein [Chitinimonas arctica]|uniref:DUF342 domain-containing protein n=1 Tax=Chitinimonas arctica TaxID=2594795 RepID=A0A516SLB0_9NEIS|nr:FapA family protein [Chitinimonas arctica]QDQ28950.1 DUF342 domain-containing protein [Chitinimonas arctica]